MKIKIITIHCIPNFGSVFQTYSLSEYLRHNGFEDVEIIDYRPNYFRPHTLRAMLAMLIKLRKYIVRSKKFDSFIELNTKLTTNVYHTLKQLQNSSIDADVLIAGGDQLWNPYHDCGKDDAYKLVFSNAKKISYSTSMGQTDFTQKELEDLAYKIKSFAYVSVREPSSVGLLDKVGIKSQMCVDPVYLLKAEHYMRFIQDVPHSKYLLVYLVSPSPLLDKAIESLSKTYGLKVILCSGFSKKCKCDLFLQDLGPEEILSYIYHADIVLSASFHATSFSLIFKKQFFTILPNPKTNARIVDLLTIRGLQSRIVTESSDFNSCLSGIIDYDQIREYDSYIQSSKSYLKLALQK